MKIHFAHTFKLASVINFSGFAAPSLAPHVTVFATSVSKKILGI